MSQDRREKIQDMLLERVEHALVDFDKVDWSKERYFHRVEVLQKLGQAVQFASSGTRSQGSPHTWICAPPAQRSEAREILGKGLRGGAVMSAYEPELGQAVFGQDSEEYAVPEHGKALLLYLLSEVTRVYWNRNQTQWEWSEMPDPQIPGLQVRPYNWTDDDAPPNFVFGDVAIRWYKHPRRGLSCNRDLDKEPDGWIKWFGSCLAAILKTDGDHRLAKEQAIYAGIADKRGGTK